MKYQFTLPAFPNSKFEMDISFWTGKSKLFKDETQVERSTEKGKPFLISDPNGDFVKAYPKPSFLDIVPTLQIDDIKYSIVERLPWYLMIFALLPFLLVFTGGGLGGGIGAVASLFNLQILRDNNAGNIKYLKVIGVTCAAFSVYFLIAQVVAGLFW
ncbi:hypothetical protein ACFX5U_10440 [Sphingobacterium sp. SG20118]|uniref:hypothetical protein n=1 Tax=Sphingobacterium TaxID=28453 RepID=UPI00246909EF|nr:hypothetical protein [Sphingobacterium faecium]MDH5826679.1 hypothetical protein [Sphingobacterium faecium]